MAIRVTPDGKVITRGGLPSCTCCDVTQVCVLFNDYGIGPQAITLTGSLEAGSFTGTYDPGVSDYSVSLTWNDLTNEWDFVYQTIPLTFEGDPMAFVVLNGAFDRQDPRGATLYYEDAMVIIEAQVMSFGVCSWVICVDNSNEVLDNSWEVRLNGHLVGTYDGADFTNTCFLIDEDWLNLAGDNALNFTRINCVSDDYFEFVVRDPTGAARYTNFVAGDTCEFEPIGIQNFIFALP